MFLTNHTLTGVGMAIILYPFFGIKSIWFLLSSILIDTDHYFSFIVKTRFSSFNPKFMFRYYDTLLKWNRRNDLLCINVLHTVEFLILMGVYAYLSKSFIAIMILAGFIFHIICDFIFPMSVGKPFFENGHFAKDYYLVKSFKTDVPLLTNIYNDELLHCWLKQIDIFKRKIK